MKGRTKKERRIIGRTIRKLRKLQNKGFDRFLLDKIFNCIVAVRTTEIAPFGILNPAPIITQHDDSVMAFATMMQAHMIIEESKINSFAIPVISDPAQIYSLGGYDICNDKIQKVVQDENM